MWETHARHLPSWDVPQVSSSFSLAVNVEVLAIVTVASLAYDRSETRAAPGPDVPPTTARPLGAATSRRDHR
jgi:hypothetical protein